MVQLTPLPQVIVANVTIFFLLTHSLDLLSVLRIVGMWVSKKCISVRNAVTPARMNPALTLTLSAR